MAQVLRNQLNDNVFDQKQARMDASPAETLNLHPSRSMPCPFYCTYNKEPPKFGNGIGNYEGPYIMLRLARGPCE